MLGRIAEIFFLFILVLYPLRHVTWGGDLWDIGYNYGNFEFGDIRSMGKMWFFSTYLANGVGHVLTLLPFGHTMIGLNVYTGLFASLLAVLGYWFCTRKLGIPGLLAFVGEWIALSMCWCPTALLYNYLTYVLFLLCLILLYLGLQKERKWMLVLAGACLGSNVLARFSNLPEMGLIVAVWLYDVWAVVDACGGRKNGAVKDHGGVGKVVGGERTGGAEVAGGGENAGGAKAAGGDENVGGAKAVGGDENVGGAKAVGERENVGARGGSGRKQAQNSLALAILGRILRDTSLCLIGYLGALAILFLLIGLFYGLDEYVSGIKLLFAMTDTATDYKPISMLYGLLWPFKESIAWWKKIAVFFVAAVLYASCLDYVPMCLAKAREKEQPCGRAKGEGKEQPYGRAKGYGNGIRVAQIIGCLFFAFVLIYWLYMQREDPIPNFTTFYYTSYDPIFWPGIVFLTVAMGIGTVEVLRKKSSKEGRFLGASVILVLLLTSIGSNNGIYPSLNNLFLAAPYVLWKMSEFTKWCFGRTKRISLNFVPVAALGWALLVVCIVQFGMFGVFFSFCEGTGQQEKGYQVENNDTLKGISTSAERAEWLQEISDYANAAGLQDREVILHGGIPAMAFYLQMKPAFHSWNDLPSFGYGTMQETIEKKEGSILMEVAKSDQLRLTNWPVVIAEKKYADYAVGNVTEGGIEVKGGNKAESERDAKWELILKFMEESGDRFGIGYQKVFENDKFVIWDVASP